MKSLRQQIEEAGLAQKSWIIPENFGSYLGLTYADVWNPQTNSPKDGWKIIGGTVQEKEGKEGYLVVLERESDFQKAIFHVPDWYLEKLKK